MALLDQPASHRAKLSAVWTSLMFCYIYCDYFELFQPGKLQSMQSGTFGLGPVSQTTLFIASALLVVPAVMVALTLLLPLRVCRPVNIVLGIFYTLVMLAVLPGAWFYFKLFGAIEIALSLSIAWLAFRWPRQA
jgi:Family of unknown function (DUF6326)